MKPRPVLLGTAGLLTFLAAWELISRLGIVRQTSLPPASTTLARLAVELGRPELWTRTLETLAQIVAGTGLCLVIAVPLGLLIGRLPAVDAYSRTSIDFLRAVPGLALVPLFVMFIGARPEMVVGLATFVALWPLLTQTIDGARSVEPLALEMARSFRLGGPRTFARIVLPSAAPYIVTGLRITLNVTLLVAIGTQLLVGAPGIGQQMAQANANGDGLAIFALSIWAGVIGVALNLALRWAEDRVMAWHKASTAQGGAA
ncbi:ABC transporter permease [Specibacter cremeus]|uniref:ABC transporter permease n=1 Tax=Specibacter cremeus TaxID=1629051 RepID=UPI0013DDB8E0|nr:ABC transporter permease [Specibacter cremeus]